MQRSVWQALVQRPKCVKCTKRAKCLPCAGTTKTCELHHTLVQKKRATFVAAVIQPSASVVYWRPCKFPALSIFGLLFIQSPVDRRLEHTTKRQTVKPPRT